VLVRAFFFFVYQIYSPFAFVVLNSFLITIFLLILIAFALLNYPYACAFLDCVAFWCNLYLIQFGYYCRRVHLFGFLPRWIAIGDAVILLLLSLLPFCGTLVPLSRCYYIVLILLPAVLFSVAEFCTFSVSYSIVIIPILHIFSIIVILRLLHLQPCYSVCSIDCTLHSVPLL